MQFELSYDEGSELVSVVLTVERGVTIQPNKNIKHPCTL
jgi:hypothetical protein